MSGAGGEECQQVLGQLEVAGRRSSGEQEYLEVGQGEGEGVGGEAQSGGAGHRVAGAVGHSCCSQLRHHLQVLCTVQETLFTV